MQKRTKIFLIIIASIVLIIGAIFGIIDYDRIVNNKMPLFMVSLRNKQDPHNYIGLGYRMQRFTGLSHKQPLSNDSWVKFGTWLYIKEIEIKSNFEDVEKRQGENSISCNKDDFEMSFYTDKKQYKTTDKIKMWVALKYVGKKDSIKIYHAGSAHSDTYIYYSISDGKNFNVDSVSNMMGKTTLLTKDKLYHFDYQKSGSWDSNDPNADFWENFYKEKDLLLPKGEYTITAKGGFSLTDYASKAVNLICTLKIKVVD